MANTALLVMDVQQAIVDLAGNGSGYLARLRRAIDGARAAGIPVIYVVIALRTDRPEVSSRNKAVSAAARAGLFTEDDPGTEIHPEVGPRRGDIVITKRRTSAFSGSDLDLVLRSRDIDSLVLTGISTSGVVLSTWCQAADLDFALTVLTDACLDLDPEMHRFLTEKLLPRQAHVTTVQEWLAG
ncbi:cysteine hydrolase family protein [Streptomyces niger]|uniref:cysteine hydrolase family protein n=1 Tax=Streptomyces niger TaxID=66373 RepID=UPI00069AF464|nr:isochorismatase family cysteine hydrolase [Streptomyces niger]